MSRSKWKGAFIPKTISKFYDFLYIQKIKKLKIKKQFKFCNFPLMNSFLGLKIYLYNGKSYHKYNFSKYKLGFKGGEFISTRKKRPKFKKIKK